jgi:hypothetical protein
MHTLEEWQQWYQSLRAIASRGSLLEAWDNRLAAQSAYFSVCLARHTSAPRLVGEECLALLQSSEQRARRRIEKAVATFIRTGTWPVLTRREYLLLIVRIQLARKVLGAIQQATPAGIVMRSQMPDLQNREHAIRWLLVDLWNLGGRAFLEAKAGELQSQPAPGASRRNQAWRFARRQL